MKEFLYSGCLFICTQYGTCTSVTMSNSVYTYMPVVIREMLLTVYSCSCVLFQMQTELKELIRAGIPSSHRSTVWKWCVRDRLGKNYVRKIYMSLRVVNSKLICKLASMMQAWQ